MEQVAWPTPPEYTSLKGVAGCSALLAIHSELPQHAPTCVATISPLLQTPVPTCMPPVQVTQLVSRGPWTSAQLREAMELAMGGCAQLDALARQVLKTAAAEAAARRQQEQQQAQQEL